MKISPKKEKIKTIIVIMILIILLLLLIFTEDIIKQQNKNKIGLFENTAKAGYTTTIGDQTYDITNAVVENANAPVISAGMMPVKYVNGYWTITTNEDSDWYDYSTGKPAYIMLNDGYYKSEIEVEISEDQLAINNIGKQISETKLGSIYMWVPRFAYNEEKIIYIKQGCTIAGEYTLPDTFTYQTEKVDYSFAGIWVEYNPLNSTSEVNTKLKNMTVEDNKYGFIANTMVIDAHSDSNIQTILQMYFDKLIANDVWGGVLDDPLIDTTNLNRTILKIINTNQLEPIKAKAYYDATEEKIRIEVTYSKNDISKILDKKGNILSENSLTADTGEELIGNGKYEYFVIDINGNVKKVIVTVSGLSIYIIPDLETLKQFRDEVNAGNKFTGITVVQTADISMNDGKYTIDETGEITFSEDAEQWESIGNQNVNRYSNFQGIYDGRGYTISGICIDNNLMYQGVFGICNGATIKNLNVAKSKIVANNDYVGGVVGCATNVENCSNFATVLGGSSVGGVAGAASSIKNCYNSGIVSGLSRIGGIVGTSASNIKNSYNIGNVNGTGSNVGGIMGYLYKGEGDIVNSYNIGNVNGTGSNVGGIMGYLYKGEGDIVNSYNIGNVNGTGSNVGGITGYLETCKINIDKCYNIGNINGNSYVAGIVGRYDGISLTTPITNCFNKGDVIGKSECCGGISGNLNYMGGMQFSYNTGEVSGANRIGGIVGQVGDYMSYLYNAGKVSGNEYIGGCVGINQDSYNLYNMGLVMGDKETGSIAGTTTLYINWTSSLKDCYYEIETYNYGVGESYRQRGNEQACTPTTKGKIILQILQIEQYKEDTNNINRGYPVLSWQTDNDKLNLINSDNVFVEDTEGVNNGYPIFEWQMKTVK